MNKLSYTVVFLSLLTFSCGMKKSVVHRPDLTQFNDERPVVIKQHDSLFISGESYLTKNKYAQWELYIQGDPLERGLLAGALMDSLLAKQEPIFFNKIEEFVPSKKKQKRLTKFLQWYNRELYKHVPNEFKAEIYGLSRYVPDTYNYIAPPYIRSLYLHGAHDIGHALVDLAMIGCTSAALWDDETEDGELLIGRNLDFYAGDEFAEEKLILFIDPDDGIPFVSIGWPGMLGVISGMNKEGLTITMNAGKSKIPLKAKKPISILAREILQYASTIDEAIAIAKNSEVFVSEALMIGSANDNKAVVIEMSPKNFGVYEIVNSRLVCSNHFQSEAYKDDKRNNKAIEESHSQYRFERMNELLDEYPKVDPTTMASILRNKYGENDEKLGFGNEKALNQLLAHHAVIFKPSEKKIWISSNPYQLGEFTSYDLDEIFNDNKQNVYKSQLIDSLTIPEDDFQYTKAFEDYEAYRVMDRKIDEVISSEDQSFDLMQLNIYRTLNPELWIVHYKSGLIYYNAEKYEQAKSAFETALSKEVTTVPAVEQIEKILKKTNKKLK
ncbi:C45 family autoproteolytic acyltransferase/hydolase [Brumimicrobium aurantiacum]|uniref:Acyl-CoA--6-aminopenicillanic acid acyl-transferase n=1 Tax=Brumimicrobium aurantiacum TaxID=1737063 RepID=A0A3E1EZL8_9FLAO|nr:C45 family peptidase [Brumimicrobium aurantiacum]RFC54923.1 acyl-CoA--6-aminopenicillanic acid acyl-transferase [Brumimicrobium aurantiacum]